MIESFLFALLVDAWETRGTGEQFSPHFSFPVNLFKERKQEEAKGSKKDQKEIICPISRFPRMLITGEPIGCHVMSITALDGFVLKGSKKEFLVRPIKN